MGSRPRPHFLLCLVTDRRRLCAARGRPLGEWPALLERQLAGAVDGGVDLVQFREKDLDAAAALGFLRGCLGRLPGLRERLLVNDRLDLALALPAAGVHLPERSFSVAEARRLLGPSPLIGRSVHAGSTPESYRGASYVVAGTVFRTDSKAGGAELLGVAGLRAAVGRAGDAPVLAIGGVGASSAGAVLAAGAAGAAAIGWFIPDASEPIDLYVKKRAAELRLAFDSARRPT